MGRRATAAPPPEATAVRDGSAVRTRRRFARRQWARRWLAWKHVVGLLLLVGVVAGAVWLVYFSSYLAVEGVEIDGAHQLRPEQIRAAAAVPDGRPLARVDLDRIRSRVEAMAPVRSADVSRQWPDQVLIRIEERRVIAVVEFAGRLRGMDADGVVFKDFTKAPPDLPLVEASGQIGSDALHEAALVVTALPADLARRVDHVRVGTVDKIALVLRDDREVLWGSAEQSEEKAKVLDALLHHPAQRYDVSVPGQPTTKG